MGKRGKKALTVATLETCVSEQKLKRDTRVQCLRHESHIALKCPAWLQASPWNQVDSEPHESSGGAASYLFLAIIAYFIFSSFLV